MAPLVKEDTLVIGYNGHNALWMVLATTLEKNVSFLLAF